jgi:protein O-GlcNAc transferase
VSELRAALAARDFATAEKLARNALALDPADSATRRLLAALLLEQGRAAEALKALDGPSDNADLAFLRGHAHAALENARQAASAFAAAAAARPGWPQAWAAEGLMRHRLGELANAQASYAKALALQQDDADTREKLAAVLDDAGDAAAAQALLEEGLARTPDAARLWLGLGLSLLREGRNPAAAAEKFAAARKLAPDDAELAYNHALALAKSGDAAGAEAAYRDAIARAPGFAPALLNLGNLLADARRLAEASEFLARAVAVAAPTLGAWQSHSSVRLRLTDAAGAAAAARNGLERHPNDPDLRLTLGAALWELGELAQAQLLFESLLDVARLRPSARQGLSNILYERAEPEAAMRELEAALAERPGEANLAQSLAFVSQYSAKADSNERLRCAAIAAAAIEKRAPAPRAIQPQRGKILRLGVVSGDLHGHPVGHYLLPVIEAFDPQRVATFCYANGSRDDAVSARLRAASAGWRRVETLDDATLVQRIRDDGIDILLDLAGYTPNNRLGVFAARAAPLQGSWLGYPATTALREIDFVVADEHLTPPEIAPGFTERVVRMAGSCMPFAHPFDDLPVPTRPTLAGRAIRFGSYSNAAKLSPVTLEAWAAILHKTTGSTLRLCGRQYGFPEVASELERRFAGLGIPVDRLILAPALPRRALVESYGEIDIALDPFPWSGGVTSFEALWMGAPVVTLAADRAIGRVGVSILAAIDRMDLVAATPDGYVAVAAALASDPQRLEKLWQTLRPALAVSSCFDMQAYVRSFLAALDAAWAAKFGPA